MNRAYVARHMEGLYSATVGLMRSLCGACKKLIQASYFKVFFFFLGSRGVVTEDLRFASWVHFVF